MNIKRKFSVTALGAIFLVLTGVSLYVSFKAGCMGDTKTGLFGDPSQALKIEDFAFVGVMLSAVTGAVGIVLQSRSSNRVTHALAFAICAVVCLWILGVEFESYGVQVCFKP